MNINHEQYLAVAAFAKKYGKNWKEKLADKWSNGSDDREPNGHLLRQLRNNFGPGWLYKYKLRDPRLEQIEIVAKHYLVAALWADKPEGTNPRITKASEKEAFRQCERFIDTCGPLFDAAMERFTEGYGAHPDAGSAEAAFGHDFWLTRNGHGTGFWDRKELERDGLGDKLTELCQHKEASYDFANGWFNLYPENS